MMDQIKALEAHLKKSKQLASELCDGYVLVRMLGRESVRPKSKETWTYCCPFEVKLGDHVVVPFGRENLLRIGIVADVTPSLESKRQATKWVAAVFSKEAHDMRMALGTPEVED